MNWFKSLIKKGVLNIDSFTNIGEFFPLNPLSGGSDTDKNSPIFASLFILTILLPNLAFAQGGYHITKTFDVVPNDKNGNKKVILITIDDGPSKYGKDMMATLDAHHAKAIFFINGIHDKANLGNIVTEAKAGFSIGNHTWNHPNLSKEKNKDKVKKEIDDTSKLIKSLTGASPRFFRPPFGVGTEYVRGLVKKDNMIYMNWSGAAKDWEKSAHDQKVFIKNVMTTVHPGEILLIHEHEWTKNNLDALLSTIEKAGYTFLDPSEITAS